VISSAGHHKAPAIHAMRLGHDRSVSEGRHTVTREMLSADEWALVCGLRDIPDGIARGELLDLLLDLVAFARDPRCPAAQGDGVPCLTVSAACEQCRRVGDVLALLHRRLAMA
jgi:hypothetical protein